MKSTRILLRATRTIFASVVGFFVLACFAQGLLAGPLGTYQEIFVTADTTAATSTSIGTYNSFVAAEAAQSSTLPSGLTWTAVASTAAVSASTNAPSGSYPVYNTAGQLVSVGNTIYSGSLTNAVGYNQFGAAVPATPYLWTGSGSAGQSFNPLGGSLASIGQSQATDAGWLGGALPTQATTGDRSMFALSGPITAADAGGGISAVGGAQVAAAGTSLGTFSSNYQAPADQTALSTALGSAAYTAINFSYPGEGVGAPPTPIQVWDLGLTTFPPNPLTVMLHFDTGSATMSQLSSLTIEHYTGGQWQFPPAPIKLDLVADTITFQTSSFSPFMLAVVPEPSSLILMGLGLLGLAAATVRARRSRKV